MKTLRDLAVLALVIGLAGCYHVTVETGKPASGTVIENQWALGFVYGIVPPPTVSTAAECPNGVARVESQVSFLNGLVGGLTGQLITPMTITVTCAAGGMEEPDAALIEVDSPEIEDLAAALNEAAVRSWALLGSPVYVSVD